MSAIEQPPKVIVIKSPSADEVVDCLYNAIKDQVEKVKKIVAENRSKDIFLDAD